MTEQKKSEVLFSKVINKLGKSGAVYGSIAIATKIYDGNKFIQITQEKVKFVNGQRTIKTSSITLNPKDEEVKKVLLEAFKY